MAELQCSKDVLVGLGLEETDASIQLGFYRDVLVVLWKVANESGVVSSDRGDVGVLTTAEFSVAVTESLRLNWGRVEKGEKREEGQRGKHGERNGNLSVYEWISS